MGWTVIVTAIIVLGFVITGAILYGSKRWQSRAKELQTEMEVGRLPVAPESYDSGELENLPLHVQRYFRTVLKEGQPLVAKAIFLTFAPIICDKCHLRFILFGCMIS